MSIIISNGFTITPTVRITAVTTNLVLSLDAGDAASYPGSGTVWTDTIGGRVFNLYNGGRTSPLQTDPPTYNSSNGDTFNLPIVNSNGLNLLLHYPTLIVIV
jgi:hypothetical protein